MQSGPLMKLVDVPGALQTDRRSFDCILVRSANDDFAQVERVGET